MFPAAATLEAGTVAVSCVLLMKVVVSWVWFGPTFHRMMAPETKPPPVAVMVKLESPALAVCGLRNISSEDDVWTVKFVLNWEQPPASPNTTSAVISQLREYIRTRSSQVILTRRRADEIPVSTIRVLRKPATIE